MTKVLKFPSPPNVQPIVETMSDLIVTNADLWNALVGPINTPGPLVELVALDTPLPASNLLRRSLRLAQAAFADLDADRMKLVKQYVSKDEQTGEEVIQPEFQEEFGKLMQVEVVLPGCVAVKVADLGKVEFSGRKLDAIRKFVVEE